jgi:hypothetical protein
MQYASGTIYRFAKHDRRSLHRKDRFPQLSFLLHPRPLWSATKVFPLSRISSKYLATRGYCFKRVNKIKRQKAIGKKSHDLGAYPKARFTNLCSAEYWTKVTSGWKILEQRKNRFFGITKVKSGWKILEQRKNRFFGITKPKWFEKKHIMSFLKSDYYIQSCSETFTETRLCALPIPA